MAFPWLINGGMILQAGLCSGRSFEYPRATQMRWNNLFIYKNCEVLVGKITPVTWCVWVCWFLIRKITILYFLNLNWLCILGESPLLKTINFGVDPRLTINNEVEDRKSQFEQNKWSSSKDSCSHTRSCRWVLTSSCWEVESPLNTRIWMEWLEDSLHANPLFHPL